MSAKEEGGLNPSSVDHFIRETGAGSPDVRRCVLWIVAIPAFTYPHRSRPLLDPAPNEPLPWSFLDQGLQDDTMLTVAAEQLRAALT